MSADPGTAEALLGSPRYGAMRLLIGKALHWYYRAFLRQRHDTPVLEKVGGSPLLVLPGVLNPRLTRTGEFLASQLQTDLVTQDADVLDMGTGSGVCAIAAARYARRVVAVDISPAAVRCARINVLMNALEDRIEVLQGDLFAPVRDRRFDIVVFNPPFIRGIPRDDADRAWRSIDVAERFAAGLTGHLTPTGFALVLLSTYGDACEFVRQFRRWHFDMAVVAERCFVNEKLTLLRLRRPRGPEFGST